MPKDYMPDKIDPFKAAAHGAELQGILQVRDMQRLCPSLKSNEGEVKVSLSFGKDEQGISIARGHLKAGLILDCQRCMQSFNYEIMSDFVFGIVDSEDAVERLPEEYEAVIVKDATLIIQDIIEDELIVSLPIVPMHDPAQCGVQLPLIAGSSEPLEQDSPFNVISILRSKTDSKKE